MKTLYLIPARGGSKGIPKKNIKPFCGKPLICHSIDQARSAGALPEDICISTDSEEIKHIVENYGIPVPFLRPPHLASDKAGTYEVIIHALNWYAKKGINYDRVVLLQPTSPLRSSDDISGALSLWTRDIDMVVSVTEARTNPYYNAFETNEEGFLTISKGNGCFTRRQDAPTVYEYNGAVYVITVDSLRHSSLAHFSKRIPFLMPSDRSIDLDTPLDWMMAEAIAQK